ncbi:SET domain-containing protein-lysine N-methyltransferase [Patescibacteria group bacterium]|nr:SET domain-containing protein-lysine N-methyltransferase [Patescibacteria group bacterium]
MVSENSPISLEKVEDVDGCILGSKEKGGSNINPHERIQDELGGVLEHVIAAHEYIPSEKDNPKAALHTFEIGGTDRAVFAIEDIKGGETISEFVGGIYHADKISELGFSQGNPNKYIQDHVIQVGEKDYMLNEIGFAHLLNHSCDPNCGIEGTTKIVAMREIKKGEQLTWDYRMSEDSDWLMAECQCGSPNCSKKISSFNDLSYDKRKEYGDFISDWLLEKYAKEVTAENLIASEITPKHIQEATDIIRLIFSHDYPEYAYCPNCDPVLPHGKRVDLRKVFGIGPQEYVSLDVLNDISNLPDCDECGTRMELFLDQKGTYETLEKKFEKDAWLVFLRDYKGDVVGINYAYMRPLQEIFEKEWGENYSYADSEIRPKNRRPSEKFMEKVVPALKIIEMKSGGDPEKINSETPIVCANLIALDPKYRGQKNFYTLATNTFNLVPKEIVENGFGISESVRGTLAHKLFMAAGGQDVKGVFQDDQIDLNNEDYVIVLFKLMEYFKAFYKGK